MPDPVALLGLALMVQAAPGAAAAAPAPVQTVPLPASPSAGGASGVGGQSDLPVADPAHIVAATSSCLDAVSASGVDRAKLATDHWSPASQNGSGGGVDFYMRDNILALVTGATASGSKGACTLVARIDNTDQAGTIADALDNALGGMPRQGANGQVVWTLTRNKIVTIGPSGTADRPAVRLTIMQITGEK